METKKEFTGSALTIKALTADVNINTHDSQKILISAKGPKAVIENLDIFEKNGRIFIQSKNQNTENSVTLFGNENCVIVSEGNGNVIMSGNSGGNVVIVGSGSSISVTSGNKALSLEILIPKTINLSIKNVRGKVSVAEIEGKLNAMTSGSSEIVVSAFTGDANLQASGSSDIKIKAGKINELDAQSSGSADIHIKAVAETAKLKASGNSDIRIIDVLGRLREKTSGSADITVIND
ncbi:MAG: DUF2807 domain-containing protein [Candidatus Pacebacteria bacterium]|nr:DUF2807 domain-containing protein [Candidatus Paceibacterota bacterium]